MANVKIYSKAKNGEINIVPNFKIKEFACKDGTDSVKIDLELAYVLQTIRYVGGVTRINSGYRTPNWNAKQGGASNSYHLYGRAADIKCDNLSIDELCNTANALGVKGIIRYPNFVHVDTRISQYHANNANKLLSYGKHAIPYSNEILVKGSAGWKVGIVQFKLARLGYSVVGTVDGKAGVKFDAAVKEFQQAKGLAVDGKVGINTWNTLFN